MARTAEIFNDWQSHDEWYGFGYIGSRRYLSPVLRAEADRRALAAADAAGLTDEELFAWANNKIGRWYADVCSSGFKNNPHLDRYLPGTKLFGVAE